ncbi:ionotropic receptor 21a-like [Panulirus ornatus]|uniref:ionotropic receptor 21a-like n=1 Tax=Panulirus ornatus TaxID=150431 RepID=UPI003A850930
MNQLYYGPRTRRINTWYHHRFTRQVELFPDKLANFQGAVLKVSTFNYEPCNFVRLAENGTVVLRYGMDIEIITAMARVLNFTVQLMATPNGETWGEKLANGSWYGLSGQLHRNEVDIGLACYYTSNYWLDAVSLSAPYTTELMCIMIRVEPPLPHWQALAFPFSQWTWLAVVGGLVVSGPVLYLLALASHQCGGEIKNLQDLSFAWYYAFGLHFCEAHRSLPRNPCTQVFVQFLWLYTLILTTSYSASLKAFLLVKKQPATINTFKELYESQLEVAGPGELLEDELAKSSDPYAQGLAKYFKYYETIEDMYPMVLQGKSVYLGNKRTIDYIMDKFTIRGVSPLRVMKETYGSYSVVQAFQRHSPLKRKFDVYLGMIQDSGLVRKFVIDSLQLDATLRENKTAFDESELRTDGVVALNLDNMQGLFIMTVFGWLCGLLSFMLEKTVLSR